MEMRYAGSSLKTGTNFIHLCGHHDTLIPLLFSIIINMLRVDSK